MGHYDEFYEGAGRAAREDRPTKTVEERRAEVAARKPTIVLDWDGTLVEDAWPEMGDWKPGAVQAIEDFLNAGYRVVVHSCRTHSKDVNYAPRPKEEVEGDFQAIRDMLDEADLGIVDIIIEDKPPADHYVDDKAIRFEGNWEAVVKCITCEGELEPVLERAGSTRCHDCRDGDRGPSARGLEMYEGLAPLKNNDDLTKVRTFETGATRNLDAGKHDYEAYLSPLVIRRYGEYMAKHAVQADGTVRPGDNWQKGIPLDSFASSGWRHFMDWWLEHRGHESREGLEEALCGLLFNAMGYLHETLMAQLEEAA